MERRIFHLAKIVVPKFLSSDYLRAGSKEEKEKLLDEAGEWLHLPTTKKFLKYVEQLQKEEEQEELQKSDFITLFQSRYWTATNKGKRTAYQTIIKLLK